jgi:hypothetical protein
MAVEFFCLGHKKSRRLSALQPSSLLYCGRLGRRRLPVAYGTLVDVEAAASVISQAADGTVRAQVCAGFTHIAVNIKVDRVTAYVVGILHAANTAVVLGCAAGRWHDDIAESFGNLIDDDLKGAVDAVGDAAPRQFFAWSVFCRLEAAREQASAVSCRAPSDDGLVRAATIFRFVLLGLPRSVVAVTERAGGWRLRCLYS